MKCIVVTPEKTVIDQETDFVSLPLYDGELGIAPGHTPLIGRLGAGDLRLSTSDQKVCWFIEGGFVEILNDQITILTSVAFPIEKLSLESAHKALETALARDASTEELRIVREDAVKSARSQIRVAEKYRS